MDRKMQLGSKSRHAERPRRGGLAAVGSLTVFASMFSSCAPVSPGQPSPFSVSTDSADVVAGDTLTATVKVDAGANGSDAVSAVVAFPESKLTVESVTVDTETWDLAVTAAEDSPGRILVESGATNGAVGEEKVATIGFRATAPVSSSEISVASESVVVVAGESAAAQAAETANRVNLSSVASGLVNYDIRRQAETYPSGTLAGSCREFVNNVFAALGINTGGGWPNDYFLGFVQNGATRITDASSLKPGDVVQLQKTDAAAGLHTFIIRYKVSGTTYSVIDSNHLGDNRVRRYDRSVVLDDARRAYRMGGPTPGDANFDGLVNVYDLILVSTYWRKTVPYGMLGDLNGDAAVNVYDLAILSKGWFRG